MNTMPTLETKRLLIRPFSIEDLQDTYRLFDIELGDTEIQANQVDSLADREEWLHWTVSSYHQLARMNQPPYGDRAIVLKSSGELIGSCGYVPCLNAFEQIPKFSPSTKNTSNSKYSAEIGLFYAVSPHHQRNGYAVEAATAPIEYAFEHINLRRIVATTEYENHASIAVMKRLGMLITRNPYPDPPWLQVVGVIEHNG